MLARTVTAEWLAGALRLAGLGLSRIVDPVGVSSVEGDCFALLKGPLGLHFFGWKIDLF